MTSHPSTPVLLRVGDAMPDRPLGPLTRTDFVRYAGAGGDLNPLHHDEERARSAGHPTVFGMGLLHAGVLGMRLAEWVGPHNIVQLEVRFTAQVWPGDVLAVRAVVAGTRDTPAGPVADLELEVRNQAEVVVLAGTSEVRTTAS